VFHTIFANPTLETVSHAWDEVRDQLATSFPRVGPTTDDTKAEAFAFTGVPKIYWRKI
jgi:transposase-like protein